MQAVELLLKVPERFWEKVGRSDGTGRMILEMAVFIVISSAFYGYVLASWRSQLLGLYVAVKLPVLMLGTTSLVMLLNWISATALRSNMSFVQVVALTYGAMGVTCLILAGLVPVTAFFTFFAAPANEVSSCDARFTHNCLLLVHVLLIGTAGMAGNMALIRGFRVVAGASCPVRKLYWCWVSAFAVVGCQLSWILRPFIGSPFFKVAFIREDCLKRNFFEFIFTEVIPYVLKGG